MYEPFQEDDGWRLDVQLPSVSSEECPVLDISEKQIRIASSSPESVLCVPVPWGGSSGSPPVPKWSRRKRMLSIRFSKTDLRPSPQTDLLNDGSAFAEQIAARGWGCIDGFLPGPEADELCSYVFAQKAAGKLSFGKNSHEGPVDRNGDNGTKVPMKNDEYTFVDSSCELPACLREVTQRCNRLLAKLLVTERLQKLQGKNLWQGHPMLAVYPGNGAAYGRHLDSTAGGRGANGRILTLVLYLNPFWQPSHGGQLRLLEQLADETGTELEPLHGRLVGFLCEDQNPHEVLPCWKERVAVTIWYYDGDRLSERCEDSNLAGVFEGG